MDISYKYFFPENKESEAGKREIDWFYSRWFLKNYNRLNCIGKEEGYRSIVHHKKKIKLMNSKYWPGAARGAYGPNNTSVLINK